MLRSIESKLKDATSKRRRKDGSYYYITNENDENFLLECIRKDYFLDWRIITAVKYDDYIWWSYPNFKQREFKALARKMEVNRELGLPKCILKIIHVVNTNTYFNKQIRQFYWVITWQRYMLLYYKRYYRYFRNKRLFGRKNFLSVRNGHKLHLISYINYRKVTGHRLNKGHMVF